MKKVLSLLLAMAMLLTMVSAMAFSASADTLTDVLYTFEEGSRPANLSTDAFVTSRSGRTAYANLEDGEHGYVLRTARKVNNQDMQDQALCIKLPSDIWTSHDSPSALSFDIKTDEGTMNFSNNVTLSAEASNAKSTSFAVSMSSINSTWKTVTMDLTTTAATTAISNNYLFLNMVNTWGSNNTCNYFYVDNISVTYEGTAPAETDYSTIAGVTNEEASIRVGEKNGIRFTTDVDTDLVETAISEGYSVAFGTLIAPADGELLTIATNPVLVIPTPGYYNNIEGKIAGSIVTIKETNIKRDFIARGYVTLTKDGESTTYYAEQANAGRSLKYVATATSNDAKFFNYLTETQQHQVLAWANA